MANSPDDVILPVGKLSGALLGRLISAYAVTDSAVVVGPGVGRDAAAIVVGDVTLVAKTDPITFATDSVARYLVNVNANDLACMGATPRWILVTALFPEGKTTEATVEAQFRELHDVCVERGISLIGGHTEITPGLDRPILIGHLLGTAPTGRLLRPGGAKPGDVLLLTKALAIEGTALIARERRAEVEARVGAELAQRAARLLGEPGISVVADAATLLDAGGVTALHDPTEGGLATGVRELAAASGCGAWLDGDQIPIMSETAAVAAAFDLDPLGMLASGSLLAAVNPVAVAGIERACRAASIPVTKIGRLQSADVGFTLRSGNRESELPTFLSDEVARALGTKVTPGRPGVAFDR